MNYIKLNIGGEERGAKLGLGFIRFFSESENTDVATIFESTEGPNALIFIPKAIYYSLAYNCQRKGETADFTIDDVFDWIDEIGPSSPEVLKWIEAFGQSFKTDDNLEPGKQMPPAKRKKVK